MTEVRVTYKVYSELMDADQIEAGLAEGGKSTGANMQINESLQTGHRSLSSSACSYPVIPSPSHHL